MPRLFSRARALLVAAGLTLTLGTVGMAAPAVAAAASPQVIVQISSLYQKSHPASMLSNADAGQAQLDPISSLSRGIIVYSPGSDGGASIRIEPESGEQLTVGRFADLSSTSPNTNQVELSVGVGSTFQTVSGGVVDILDLAADSSGRITRFDVVFRTVTDVPSFSIFGEIRLGQPGDDATILSARQIQWPTVPVGSVPILSKQRLHNTTGKGVMIGSIPASAGAKGDFVVVNDRCSGKKLMPGLTCSFSIGFSPKAPGPRVATLSIPVGSATETVALSGQAPLGTNSIVISGDDYVDGGTSHTLADGPYTILGAGEPGNYSFRAIEPYSVSYATVTALFDTPNQVPLAVGTHDAISWSTVLFPPAHATQYGMSVSGFYRGCGSYSGTITVRTFTTAPDGNVLMADLSFTQRCNENPSALMTGELKYQLRSDTKAPSAVTSLQQNHATRTVTWTPSASPDVAQTIARLVPGTGAGATPTSGYALTAGSASSAKLPPLVAKQRYTVVVFAVDTAGNVSNSRTVAVIG